MKAAILVPTCALTVRITDFFVAAPDNAAGLQTTVVVVVQDVVRHMSSAVLPDWTVGVRFPVAAKLRPNSVTNVPELMAALTGSSRLMTGASYVNPCVRVPTTAETVTMALTFTAASPGRTPVL